MCSRSFYRWRLSSEQRRREAPSLLVSVSPYAYHLEQTTGRLPTGWQKKPHTLSHSHTHARTPLRRHAWRVIACTRRRTGRRPTACFCFKFSGLNAQTHSDARSHHGTVNTTHSLRSLRWVTFTTFFTSSFFGLFWAHSTDEHNKNKRRKKKGLLYTNKCNTMFCFVLFFCYHSTLYHNTV